MIKEGLLSVIVPVYNTEEYLDRCIESILDQTYKNFSIVLIDDGSKDRSSEKCDYYANKYSNIVVKHTNNNGLSSARNLGITLSNSKYLSFIDSDDWIEKLMFEKLMFDALENDADISGCNMYSAVSYFEKREKNEMNILGESALVFKEIEILKEFYKLFSVCNKIFKKTLFNDIRFPEGKIFEDARTTYRLAAIAKIATFNGYNGYNYYQRDNGIIRTLSDDKMYDRVLMWNEISSFILKNIPGEYDYLVARKNRSILEAIDCIKIGNIEIRNKLIEEIIYTQENKFLSEQEVSKIKALKR